MTPEEHEKLLNETVAKLEATRQDVENVITDAKQKERETLAYHLYVAVRASRLAVWSFERADEWLTERDRQRNL